MNLFCGMETGELKRHEIIMSSAKENPKFMGPNQSEENILHTIK